jgi:hypothetical protein
MKLYLLRRKGPTYFDEYVAKLVRATTELHARELANEQTGDEGKIWNNPKLVSSEVITEEGVIGVVCESFDAA